MGFSAVSVVMSVFNRETFLAEAVERILAQTFTDLEFVIIDDGSTDRAPRILSNYAERDPCWATTAEQLALRGGTADASPLRGTSPWIQVRQFMEATRL
jgi:glycosyltransferase involved in cell wall biosynthesis